MTPNSPQIRGTDGLCGTVSFPTDANDPHVEITLESGERLVIDRSALIPQPDGSYAVTLSSKMLSEGTRQVAVIPVAREELVIEKRQRETERIAVQIVPSTRRELVDLALTDETIEVERVKVNRIVGAPEPTRQEGDVTIIPVMEEVLVVEKRLRVKEEIRLVRRKSVRHEPREVELRSEEARVVRLQKKPDK